MRTTGAGGRGTAKENNMDYDKKRKKDYSDMSKGFFNRGKPKDEEEEKRKRKEKKEPMLKRLRKLFD